MRFCQGGIYRYMAPNHTTLWTQSFFKDYFKPSLFEVLDSKWFMQKGF